MFTLKANSSKTYLQLYVCYFVPLIGALWDFVRLKKLLQYRFLLLYSLSY